MAGFIRRFGEFPSDAALTAIEGVNIIDLPPPSSISGVGTGVACLIGEFTDMTYAVDVNEATGAITEDIRPVEAFSSQDLLDKVGGFDETLGQFGGDCGNGFVELRNKGFFRLVVVPVNLASAVGVRVFRDLPTNTSATDPTPIVSIQSGTVAAGRQFEKGLDLLRIAQRVVFTDDPAFITGIDGSVTTGAPAATATIDSAGSLFLTGPTPVQEGDIVVTGVIGAATPVGVNAFTLRVQSVASDTQLVVETLDGSTFFLTTDAAMVFRVHPAATADTGKQHQLSEAAGCLIPVRPLTDGQGTGADAADNTWTISDLLAPTVVPPAGSASSYNSLSGLGAIANPTVAIDFTAALQKANAPNDATFDVAYANAYTALLSEESPAREVNLVWPARKDDTIRATHKQHLIDASAIGIGRTGVISPELDIVKATAVATVTGDAAPGVGATRDERTDYSWPPALTFIPEAVGFDLATADGKTTADGLLDVTFDGFMTSALSNLAPEKNPGESSAVTRKAFAGVLGLARNVPTLTMNTYIALRSKGIAGLRIDRVVGAVIQSGITSSLLSGRKNINRRRMADFLEDSMAQSFVQSSKQLMTEALKLTIEGEAVAFLDGLLSPNNPPAQRIHSYEVDPLSGNTPSLEAKGVFVLITRVRTLATADFITIQAEVGEGVVITTSS